MRGSSGVSIERVRVWVRGEGDDVRAATLNEWWRLGESETVLSDNDRERDRESERTDSKKTQQLNNWPVQQLTIQLNNNSSTTIKCSQTDIVRKNEFPCN